MPQPANQNNFANRPAYCCRQEVHCAATSRYHPPKSAIHYCENGDNTGEECLTPTENASTSYVQPGLLSTTDLQTWFSKWLKSPIQKNTRRFFCSIWAGNPAKNKLTPLQ